VGRDPHIAKWSREASLMLPTQAEATALLPEDDSAACPAGTQVTHPSPAVDADDARVAANRVVWLLEV